MSVEDLFLYKLPPAVFWEFCRVMDSLSDLDWTRFASMVLEDQTALRLAERQENRTNWVMQQWESRNGRVSELVSLLEALDLLRPRDIIRKGVFGPRASSSPSAPPHPPLPFPKPSNEPLTAEEQVLPRPGPPPPRLHSKILPTPPDHPHTRPSVAEVSCATELMCWSYEEVHAGTKGFSPALQVGEGGFGVVYKATLRNTVFAIKVLRQDRRQDWNLLMESFQTEMEKLSKFRHPNIVELLGFSKGPGTLCLIYNYMENKSLEHELHNSSCLSWALRVSIVTGASTALQFLHCPPTGNAALIHGDVKSSNILLDHHMTAKLGDFGLARLAPKQKLSGLTTLGYTTTIRGTLAYLPQEYVRSGKLGTAVDVYSFGVVLLEVLTGRRALEKDGASGERYLKDLVGDIEEGPPGSFEASWRRQLDHRLLTGGAAEPAGCMEMVALACKCLEKERKRRPTMADVFNKLQDINNLNVNESSSRLLQPFPSFPRPARHLDSSVTSLSQELSKLGPLEDTYQPSRSSLSSSSSSSFCSLQSPHRLDYPLSLVSSSASRSLSLSSFAGPCETDESRGFSQYDLQSQLRTNGTASQSVGLSTRDQYHSPAAPQSHPSPRPSVPTEEQYSAPLQPSGPSSVPGTGTSLESDQGWPRPAGAAAGAGAVSKSLSPVRSLQSVFPGPSVVMNPVKQHLLQKKTLYEEGLIHTPELLSSDDIYEGASSVGRGPEESDEPDYLQTERE